MTTTFDQLLDSYRDLADSERMKGSYFEQLIEQYLEHDGVQAPQYTDVWLWRDGPGRDGKPDSGIDLVAERADGGVTAIQCKFYAEKHTMQKQDIDSFMSASGKKPFTHRLVARTAPGGFELVDPQLFTSADVSPITFPLPNGQPGRIMFMYTD